MRFMGMAYLRILMSFGPHFLPHFPETQREREREREDEVFLKE
jgi:hypothetical protein